jgi:dipeptidyl aminopeptidase/acylaminoacyl peptidase
MRVVSKVSWILLLAAAGVGVAEEPRSLESVDVFQLEVAADPQISPDGRKVAYVRRSMDIMTDRAVANVWVVDVDGSEHRPLLSGTSSYGSPRWSPDGGRLAYVTSAEGRGTQIHVRWMDSGQTALLTNLRESPSSLAWSPNGSAIAFAMFVPDEPRKLADPPGKPEGAEWAPPVKYIDTLKYRADGAGYLESGHTHLFVVPADGGTPRQLTEGDFNHGGPLSWSPDGKRIAFSANRNEGWEYDPGESNLWTVRVEDGELTRLTDRVGPDQAPTFSPDGETIAYLGYDDRRMGYHNTNVYVIDATGGRPRSLTDDLDRSVAQVLWAGSSGGLYVRYDDLGKRKLAGLSLDGRLADIVDDIGGATLGRPYTSGGFSVAKDGTFAYTQGRVDRPADVAAGKPGDTPRALTRLNQDLLAHRSLGSVEEMTWRSSVGDHDVQGWLVTPPDFDPGKKYPFILEIHGGPFAAYGPHFSSEVQLFAAAGYVVLYANPRGSTSYGDAFANEIHHAYPGQDYDDLMSGVDAVIARGFVDPDRLFVTGGSGGGVLTAWIVGKTNRFAGAVVAKPVINWVSTVLTTDIAAFMPRYWFAKNPWEDPAEYWRRSPLSLVGNVTTPTMVLTGEEDHRTPMPESEQYYQALQLRKIDSALVRVPEASHGIAARPSHLIAKVDNILAWFARCEERAAAEQSAP